MDAEERKRIYETGGFVRYNRVNGNLALSRAFGDFGKFLQTLILRQRQVEIFLIAFPTRRLFKFKLELRSQAEF